MKLGACRSSKSVLRAALVVLLGLWLISAIVIPVGAADLVYMPNEYIVHVLPGSSSAAIDQSVAKLGASVVGPLSVKDTYLIRIGRTAGDSTSRYYATRVTPQATQWVIDRLQPNYIYYPNAIPTDPYWNNLWGMQSINIPKAWEIEKGADRIVVAVNDTGVARHPDLVNRMLPGYDFADNDNDPTDGDGHGTHVAGTIAAQGNNSIGVVGVCWDKVRILPVRVLGTNGGTSQMLIDGLEYARQQGAHVVNMSYGIYFPGADDFAQRDKLIELKNAGIILVAAAGNLTADLSAPAKYDETIAVAAVGPFDGIAPYSSFGPRNEVDIAAPGGDSTFGTEAEIFSTGYNPTTKAFGYEYMQGTSMAAPHVSGAAALLLSEGVPASDVRSRLINSARPPKTGTMDTVKYGAGILDVQAALSNASIRILTPVKGSTVNSTPDFKISIRGISLSSIKVYLDYGDLNEDGIPDNDNEMPIIDGSNVSSFTNTTQTTIAFNYSQLISTPLTTGTHTIYVKGVSSADRVSVAADWLQFSVAKRVIRAGMHLCSFPYPLDTATVTPQDILPSANFSLTNANRSLLMRWVGAPRTAYDVNPIGYQTYDPSQTSPLSPSQMAWSRPLYDPYDLSAGLGIGKSYAISNLLSLSAITKQSIRSNGGGTYYDTATRQGEPVFTAGSGFWLIVPFDTAINDTYPTTDSISTFDRSKGFTIRIYKGWNMIGNPYAHNVPWRAALFTYQGHTKSLLEAEAAGWINSTLFAYRNTGIPGYQPITSRDMLETYRGYWLRSSVGGVDPSQSLVMTILW